MTQFNPTGHAPGVYIDEVQQPGPIPGVGTSVAAFVGPAHNGEKNKPVLVTNWTQFCQTFGKPDQTTPGKPDQTTPDITDPYIESGYLAHAVRGFFENGGTSCYVVRVGEQANNLEELKPDDYKSAIDALKYVDEVTILCVPDKTDQDIQKHMLDHCESMKDRFAILDAIKGADMEKIKTQREGVGSDSSYGALYYPWLTVANPHYKRGDPENQRMLGVPPSGHIAGLYARSDATRGVHKAPANETLRGALDLERVLTDDEQGPLNDKGINALRWFSGRGVVVWGARTLASDSSIWRYVNVRRLLLFIEESIQEATRFAVFEPNNLSLWQTVKRQITEFLTRVWRSGALFGATSAEAFQVRVDKELNPSGQVALGVLTIEVKLYPVTPAEYVIFRVVQKPGGPDVQEQ